jgi:hypothetical protein
MTGLTAEQKASIAGHVAAFQEYLDSAEQEADLAERQARSDLYAHLLSPVGLDQMTELEFGQVISSLWASRLWSKKSYIVAQLIQDNGLPTLRGELRKLLWGRAALAGRFNGFRQAVRGLGAASITEILAFVHPEECAPWNDRARKALDLLGFRAAFPAIRKSQINGQEYQTFNNLLALIRDELAAHGIRWLDLLGVNYFLYEVWKLGERAREQAELDIGITADLPAPTPSADYDFDHNEVVDQLVAVGQWLGFEAEKEKKVARGAQVDAVWQARIANLGVVTYVFEVQRKGSIDSLILNLQRAQNNPTVQRLIVVANPSDIERVRGEIAELPESFRKAVSFMDVGEVLRAARLVVELSSIIGKLDLVRGEFSV